MTLVRVRLPPLAAAARSSAASAGRRSRRAPVVAGPRVPQVAVTLAVPAVQSAVRDAQKLGSLLQVQLAVLVGFWKKKRKKNARAKDSLV